MKLTLIALGHKMPAWVESGFNAYAKRMPPELRLELIELKPEDRASRGIDKVLTLEAQRIEAVIPKNTTRVVLDEQGEALTTVALAERLRGWMTQGTPPAFIIGSADGLAPALKARADHTLALSRFTLPHGLVRVLLAEQLYRAWSFTQNHPYHRE